MALTIGVLITNYNSWEIALECVDAHLRLCGPRLSRVVLVDDCSTHPQPCDVDSRVTIVRNDTNLGLVKSLNKGVQCLDTDLVIIFDADARPLNDYAEIVIEAFSCNPRLALLGFQAVDNEEQPTASTEIEPGLSSLLLGQALYAQYSKILKRVLKNREHSFCVYTCAMALRKAAFSELGGFDEQFDWLDLDHDLSMRVNRSDWTLGVAAELLAFHRGGGTPQLTSHRVLRFYKNRWYLLRKFDKIKFPALAKFAILTRLRAEYLLLRAAGVLLFRDVKTRSDKLEGRRKIIQYCADNY